MDTRGFYRAMRPASGSEPVAVLGKVRFPTQNAGKVTCPGG